jgi:hypothetical protein
MRQDLAVRAWHRLLTIDERWGDVASGLFPALCDHLLEVDVLAQRHEGGIAGDIKHPALTLIEAALERAQSAIRVAGKGEAARTIHRRRDL